MTGKRYTQGGDAKAISEVAHKHFGGSYEAMFKFHDWPERGSDMMPKVQKRAKDTYGSICKFEAHFRKKRP